MLVTFHIGVRLLGVTDLAEDVASTIIAAGDLT
jgi:hypothetical protein